MAYRRWLNHLREVWLHHLREGATDAGGASADAANGQRLLNALLSDTTDVLAMCAEMHNAYEQARRTMRQAETGGRHDVATGRTHHIVQLGAAGHPGAGTALRHLGVIWAELTTEEGRGAEWDRLLLSSARKAVTKVGTVPVVWDPCKMSGGAEWQNAQHTSGGTGASSGVSIGIPRNSDLASETPLPLSPALNGASTLAWMDAASAYPTAGAGLSITSAASATPPVGEAAQTLEDQWSVRQIIGVQPWDPAADLDQSIADAVLARCWPVLRYGHDAGTWLLRGRDRWAARGDLSGWAVAELAGLMPKGEPSAEKGTQAQKQAARRQRLMSSAGRQAVASAMRARVAAGTHPASVAVADLDAEPWLLWAGGTAWDLRQSLDGPVRADIDPGTPHLHTAPVAPDMAVQTPLWDAWLAAVWPDVEIRAYALRVLSIALTGYADAALPILLGPTRSGKSYTVNLLLQVLGSYGAAVSPQLFNAQRASATEAIVAELKGLRLAFVDEYHLGSGPRQQEIVKRLSGGARLTADAKGQKPINFDPTHTFVFTSNPLPEISDQAIRARVRLLPCHSLQDITYPAWREIHRNPARWKAEIPGVLAKLMCETAAYLTDPETVSSGAAPADIRDLVTDLVESQDVINNWLAEETEPHPDGTRGSLLYESFRAFCRRLGMAEPTTPSLTAFGRELTARGYPPDKRRDAYYRALRLRSSVAGSWWVGGGLTTKPTTDENGTSNSVFSSTVVGVVGLDTRSVGQREAVGPDGTDRGSTTLSATNKVHEPTTPTTEINKMQVDVAKQAVLGLVQPTTPTTALTTAPAATKPKIDKAGAREARRLAKINEAAGATVDLPAVVDRFGKINSVSLTQAGQVVKDAVARSGALTVDVETTGYPVGHREHKLRTVQLGDDQAAVVFDAAEPAQQLVVWHLLTVAPKLHAHSASADLVPLEAAGLIKDGWQQMHDTVIPAKLADPSSTGADPALKKLSGAVLGALAVAPDADEQRAKLWKAGGWLRDTQIDTPVERSGWAQVDSRCETMVRYAASDVLDTAALAKRLPWPDSGLLARERDTERIVSRVAHRGLQIDVDAVRALLARETAAMDEAGARVRAAGVANPGSDLQVGTRLAELEAQLPSTPGGRPSVARAALEALRGSTAATEAARTLAADVLDYRQHETAVTTFLRPWLILAETGDGRARPTVYTLGADTGRMSCVRPNLQQVPREGGFRPCITADPGQFIISADFAGVELRVMAALSGDTNMIDMIRSGVDIHSLIAKQVFGEDWTKGDRYMVKRGVFGWAYGGSIPVLASQVGCAQYTMAAVVRVLAELAPAYVAWTEGMKQAVRSGDTDFLTYSGRIVHLDKRQPHKAPNYAVQGTAREILVDGLLRWDQSPYGGGVVLPVHDEVVAVVDADNAEDATRTLVECMTTELFGVPIAVEPSKPSFAWQDAA